MRTKFMRFLFLVVALCAMTAGRTADALIPQLGKSYYIAAQTWDGKQYVERLLVNTSGTTVEQLYEVSSAARWQVTGADADGAVTLLSPLSKRLMTGGISSGTNIRNLVYVPGTWTVADHPEGAVVVKCKYNNKFIVAANSGAAMNGDFTAMDGRPMPLFEAPDRRYNVIDSDIIHVGDTYHLFFVSHEHGATPVHATSRSILGPYEIDTLYNDNEKGGHEAPNCWKRIGEEKYILMFDNYSMRPHNFGFVETTDFRTFTSIGHFDEQGSPMRRTNFAEQKHGAVIQITKKEAKRMEKFWNSIK